ncbi:MAG: 4Fe-4S dicluster domain-containing protein [Patescibacteria group bacterium]
MDFNVDIGPKCDSCFACTIFCSFGVFYMNELTRASARSENCTGCGECDNKCPSFALTIEENGNGKKG